MNNKLNIGRYNTLEIDRESDYGLYLITSEGEDVLLPNIYVTDEMSLGDEIEVFIYKDSEDRITATTIKPFLTVGEFAFLEVVDTSDFGAFIDIGLPKHVLVPKKMQKNSLKVGQKYIFALTVDVATDRLVADTRIHRYLLTDKASADHLKAVDIMIIAKTPMGYKVIVEDSFEGMIYHDEIFQKINIGETLKAFVKKVRDDGKLDISLNPMGKNKADTNSVKILELLRVNDGMLPFTYKSDANDIKNTFAMSKKAYKASLTKLIEDKKIELNEKGIRLI